MDNDKNTDNSSDEKKIAEGDAAESLGSSQGEAEPKKDAVDNSTAKETKASSSKEQKPAPEKSSGVRRTVTSLLVLFLLLAISGLGVAGWWFYQLQQKEPVVHESLVSQQVDIQRLQEQLAEERRERLKQQAALSQTTSELQLNITSHARRLRELSTTSRKDWLLAEAEYLIRLANQRLLTERNTKNATALLLTADEILRDLDEVDLLAVREALAKSITALRMAPGVDREGLYLQLDALSEQLIKLPLIAPELLDGAKVTAEPRVTTEDSWRDQLLQGFYKAMDGLDELIRVRRRNAPLEPLLSPEEDQFLRHNLGMMFEQAQLALLREEQAIYQSSLMKAQKWLEDYFDLNEGANQLVEQLTQLEQKNVVQQLPDISGGLEALRDYVDSWHKRHTVKGVDQQDGEL